MPPECECDWSIMPPYSMTISKNNRCPQCKCWVGKKKYSGAIYIIEEAGIQGRTIDTIFCEDNIDSWC